MSMLNVNDSIASALSDANARLSNLEFVENDAPVARTHLRSEWQRTA